MYCSRNMHLLHIFIILGLTPLLTISFLPPKLLPLVNSMSDAMIHLSRYHRRNTLRSPSPFTSPSPSKKGKDIVILGSGWSAQSFVKIINDQNPHVNSITLVSPLNYFLFTPLLLSASVGTVEIRSIVEPIRSCNPFVDHIEGSAYKIDHKKKLVHLTPNLIDDPSHIENVTIPYDQLIVSVGEEATVRNVPGAALCSLPLKTAQDAQKLRTCIVNAFERGVLASRKKQSNKNWSQEVKHLLTFVVVGGGPTGLEFCGELYDFLSNDAGKLYPEIINYAKVVLVDSGRTSDLDPFKKLLKEKGLQKLNSRKGVGLAKERVVSVSGSGPKGNEPPFQVVFEGSEVVNCGTVVWAGGTAPRAIVADLISELNFGKDADGKELYRKLPVDEYMRVKNVEDGSILALGDNALFLDAGPRGLPPTAAVAAQQGPYVARLINRNYDLSVGCSSISNSNTNASLSCSPPQVSFIRSPLALMKTRIRASN